MPIPSPVERRFTVGLLLALTGVTGLVDAVSFLRLGRVFVANMTGNVVFLGFTADPHSGLSWRAALVAIGGFVVGAVAGGRLARALDHRPRRWLGTAFGAEAVIIGLVAVLAATGVIPLGANTDYATIVIMAVALGLQNSTVRHFAVPDLTTTVLSLTLTGLASDSPLGSSAGAHPVRRFGSVVVMAAGAAVGALLLRVSVSGALGVAAGMAGLVAVGWMVGPAASSS